MNPKVKKKSSYLKKSSHGMKGKMMPSYSNNSKSNTLSSMKKEYLEKSRGLYENNHRMKPTKTKPKKPKKHVFECGRKINKPLNSTLILNTNSSN